MTTLARFEHFREVLGDDQVAAMLSLADAMDSVAAAMRALGTGNAATEMGAIEYLATAMKDGIRDAGWEITEALMDLPGRMRS